MLSVLERFSHKVFSFLSRASAGRRLCVMWGCIKIVEVGLTRPVRGGGFRHRPAPRRRRRSRARVTDIFGGESGPKNPKKPVFDLPAPCCQSAPIETHAFCFR